MLFLCFCGGLDFGAVRADLIPTCGFGQAIGHRMGAAGVFVDNQIFEIMGDLGNGWQNNAIAEALGLNHGAVL